MEVKDARVCVGPARNGSGLFAVRAYRTGEIIVKLTGHVVHHRVLWARRGTAFAANCIRFGPDTYLDPRDGYGRYLNHSCVPSAAVVKRDNQLFLSAATRIRRGDEVAIDYSTTIGDDDIWTMRCNCGEAACRERIGRFGALPPALQADYLARGLVPGFIQRTLDRHSRR